MRWRRRRSALDFAEEIESHLAHETDRLVAEGWDPAAARAEAERTFGDAAALRARYEPGRAFAWWTDLVRDVRQGLRLLARERGFTLAAVLTLSLALGINTSVMTLLYAVLLRPLPLPESDRLVTLQQTWADGGCGTGRGVRTCTNRNVNGTPDMASLPELEAWRAENRTLAGLTAFAPVTLTVGGESPVAANGLLVTCDYFDVLGAGFAAGRGFGERDCSGGEIAAVLSHGIWQRQFGGDPGVIGRSIRLNDAFATVVGVAAPGFTGTEVFARDIWLPLAHQPRFADDKLRDPILSWLRPVGRLRPGVTPEQAARDLTRVARQLDLDYAGRETTVRALPARIVPLSEATSGNDAWILGLITGLITLLVVLACLNVMNLLLARAPVRRRSIRIQLALGAGRSRVVRQLLVESLLLAGLGGGLGLLIAWRVPSFVLSALPVAGLNLNITPDLRIFAYTLVLTLLAAALFGVVPALESTRVDLGTALRGDSPGGGPGPRASRMRSAVVSVQLAGSMLLVVLAGLFVRGVQRAERMDPGFEVAGVFGFRPDLSRQGYTAGRAAAFYRDFQTRVAVLPGVQSAGLAVRLPMGARSAALFSREPAPPIADEDVNRRPLVFFAAVSGEYFDLLGIPLRRGRSFTDADLHASDVRPAVISNAMAERFWPGEDPIGTGFTVGNTRYSVVGVAADVRTAPLDAPDDGVFFYAPIRLHPVPGEEAAPLRENLTLVVRATASSVAADVRRIAAELDGGVLLDVESLEANLESQTLSSRVAAVFAGLLGLLATILAAIGVYGAVACSVSQRTREIGVRIALGASAREVTALVLRQGGVILGGGLLAGAALAAAVARVIRGMLFGVSPLDPAAFIGTAAILAAIAALAMLRPARRATCFDPAVTLRSE